MCGACGGVGPDWALPFVSGPLRRSVIAKFLTTICRGVTVGTMPLGWTVRTATGGWSVARTLDELVDATARRLSCTSWPELQAVVRARSSGRRGSPDGGASPRPSALPLRGEDSTRLSLLGAKAEPVLTEPGDLCLRLTGFVLGIRRFERRVVALDLDDWRRQRLVAAEGRIVAVVGQRFV